MSANDPWPSEIRREDDGRRLVTVFEDGATFSLTAEHLRVRSPSAEVRGHGDAERKTVGGRRNVRILAVAPVGNYAVRLDFDDGHSTGIYTWRELFTLGRDGRAGFRRLSRGARRQRPRPRSSGRGLTATVQPSAVVGSILRLISLILFAGKPPCSACCRMSASFGAM